MDEIYIPELNKYLSREECIMYFRDKKDKEKVKNDLKYKKLCELGKQNEYIIKHLENINEKLDEIINILKRGDKISIDRNLKNTLLENSTK